MNLSDKVLGTDNQQERLGVNKYTVFGLLTALFVYMLFLEVGKFYFPTYYNDMVYKVVQIVLSLAVFRFISNKFHF